MPPFPPPSEAPALSPPASDGSPAAIAPPVHSQGPSVKGEAVRHFSIACTLQQLIVWIAVGYYYAAGRDSCAQPANRVVSIALRLTLS